MTAKLNLYQQACKWFPHHEAATRHMIHRLRAKYIRCLQVAGDKWLFHPDNFVKRKDTNERQPKTISASATLQLAGSKTKPKKKKLVAKV